jgi:putative ABC transport system permease protein
VVVNAFLVPSSNTLVISDNTFRLEGFTLEDEVIPEVYIDITSPFTGETRQLQVIGVLESFAFYAGGPILTSETILSSLSPAAIPASSYLFKVREGADVAETARLLEATFVENGLQTSVTAETIAEQASANIVLNNLLQGFMSLGLVVGIAALGVISARSVVERYHHIGMLRAIGFQQRMVQFSFMLESSFVTLVGIALGIVLGIGISRNVIDSFAESTPGIEYVFPWTNILLIVAVTYSAALLITYLTARQAAKVNPADALRFE